MTERQTYEVDTTESYSDFVGNIKRNLDPNSNTVLVVDDERGIRMKLMRDIKAFDPSIVIYEAANGSEAMEKLKQIRGKYRRDPLFIILDLNMPIMDGWEVIRTLKKEYETAGKEEGIPILVLSSTSGEKGMLFSKQSVHDGKSGYTPLVSIAKEKCVDKRRYDATGEKSLINWIKHFLK
jgi:CheY-like chemotaxis protein